MEEMSFKQKKETHEYKEGQSDFNSGVAHSDSKYPRNTEAYRLWSLGWIIEKINSRVGHILEKYGQTRL